jgi:aspartate aminotransferase-like enzyme
MPGLLPHVDPDGLLEYSVVYTDRALNHMSRRFGGVMRDISGVLKQAYAAHSAVVVPGSGSFGMEAVARQFATGQHVLVLRNGWFSYRWSQILEAGGMARSCSVLKARRLRAGAREPFAPAPLDEVVAAIERERPALVFAPHVETSAGLVLPDDYLRTVADAVHAAGGLFVLDCIASGALWVDMQATGVDVLISAPQKGWSGSPCCAFVMLSAAARERIDATTSSSFALDLKKWLQVMETYESGSHIYHTTMPTDAQPSSPLAAACARSWWRTATRAWPRPASRPPASSSATPVTPRCRAARPSWRWVCRPPRACRCSAMKARTSAPSASACSGSRSSAASSRRCSRWKPR